MKNKQMTIDNRQCQKSSKRDKSNLIRKKGKIKEQRPKLYRQRATAVSCTCDLYPGIGNLPLDSPKLGLNL